MFGELRAADQSGKRESPTTTLMTFGGSLHKCEMMGCARGVSLKERCTKRAQRLPEHVIRFTDWANM